MVNRTAYPGMILQAGQRVDPMGGLEWAYDWIPPMSPFGQVPAAKCQPAEMWWKLPRSVHSMEFSYITEIIEKVKL